jgi:Ca2+-binding RTX toxin-like protein
VRAFLLGAACLLIFVAGTANAAAATALVEPSDTFFGLNTLRYIAGTGETNSITMSPMSTLAVEITDPGATITAGPGCTSLDPNTVRCDHESGLGFIEMVLGDGDDALALPGVRVDRAAYRGQDGDDTLVTGGGLDSLEYLLGGPGNDTLKGRGGSDFLNGGSGADTLSGGTSVQFFGLRIFEPAIDTVTYAGRTNAVHADPDGVADDGEAGEGDMLEDDVEELIGGSGDDVLVGTTAQGRIRGEERLFGSLVYGRGGDDTLRGARAGDTLIGDRGNDILRGAPGDDTLMAGRGHDALLGNRGQDFILGGSGNDRLVGGRARDALRGGAGRDLLLAREGRADRVGGGAGFDRARVDHLDIANSIESLF